MGNEHKNGNSEDKILKILVIFVIAGIVLLFLYPLWKYKEFWIDFFSFIVFFAIFLEVKAILQSKKFEQDDEEENSNEDGADNNVEAETCNEAEDKSEGADKAEDNKGETVDSSKAEAKTETKETKYKNKTYEFYPNHYIQDSDKSIVNTKGKYDLTRYSLHEDDIIKKVLSVTKSKYPFHYQSVGLANESQVVIYKPRYVLLEIIVQKYKDSIKPIDQIAVAFAYQAKGAAFRQKAIAYFESAMKNLNLSELEQFSSLSSLPLLCAFGTVYEREHEYSKSIRCYKELIDRKIGSTQFFIQKISELEEKEANQKPLKRRNSKQREKFEYNVRIAANHYIKDAQEIEDDEAEEVTNKNNDDSFTFSDKMVIEAAKIIFDHKEASEDFLVRKLNIKRSDAFDIIDELVEVGAIGFQFGADAREICMSASDFFSKEIIIIQRKDKVTSNRPKQNRNSRRQNKVIKEEKIIAEESKWRMTQFEMIALDHEIQRLNEMDKIVFRQWCSTLLEKCGFTDLEIPKSENSIADIIAIKESKKYSILCVQSKIDLEDEPILKVHAGKMMYHCQIGVVMTNRHFTPGAKQLAEATGVLLWDRDKLGEMLGA